MTATRTRTAVVTGGGGGLGRDISLGLATSGYRVFGTALAQAEVDDLRQASDGAVTLATCDITDAAAVESWADDVSAATGGQVDVLINNAGILTPGPLETLPLDEVRREFEVNVFGALSVINAFLPQLRAARGRVIQISTITARLPLPFNGPSGASKAAMEAFAAVYRAELKPFGVDFVIAAPGHMKTTGSAKTAGALAKVAEGLTADQRAIYGERFEHFAEVFNAMQSSGRDPRDAAADILALADQTPAPSYAPVGDDAVELMADVKKKPEAELDELRLQMFDLS